MAYQIRYDGESHHLLPLLGQLLVEDPIANEWHVEVTTSDGTMTEGIIIAAQPYEAGVAGTVTVQPFDYDTHKPKDAPPVTIATDDVTEFVVP
jgi:hypothetical protein